MRITKRTAILAAAAALGVLVLLLARGQEPSSELRALQADPMAAYVPPGGAVVDTDSQNEGTSLGRPVPARYMRLFRLSGDGGRALADARAAALAAGWAPVGKPGPRAFVADRAVPSGKIELDVSLLEDARLLPQGVAPPALLVSLRHLGS